MKTSCVVLKPRNKKPEIPSPRVKRYVSLPEIFINLSPDIVEYTALWKKVFWTLSWDILILNTGPCPEISLSCILNPILRYLYPVYWILSWDIFILYTEPYPEISLSCILNPILYSEPYSEISLSCILNPILRYLNPVYWTLSWDIFILYTEPYPEISLSCILNPILRYLYPVFWTLS